MRSLWQGGGLRERLLRSSGWLSFGFIISQGLRLGSNLILTRLLFPEAFGLMALISVFIVGLGMLSDIGVAPSIQQSRHGDDPDFLNTAWTIQAIRGGLLWLLSWPLGIFAAWLYDDPRFALMLPAAGLSLLIGGFNPTRIDTASRHLALGRVTLVDLVAQGLGLAVMVTLAAVMKSVWALVLGGILTNLIRLFLMDRYLAGPRNQFHWNRAHANELIHFGKWIFLSTLCGFALAQGDKTILGTYINFEMLGIYNIGFFLASFPQALAGRIMSQVMIPIHRECPPGASAKNYAQVRKTRFLMTAVVFVMQFTLALCGVWVVDLIYDARFAAAGAVVVAVACMGIPYLIGMTYDYAALGQGDSRGLFRMLLVKAVLQTTLFILGMEFGGLGGAFFGLWLSQVIAHPFVILLARKHGAWDPWHDLFYAVLGFSLTLVMLDYHREALAALQSFGQ